ncbi:hypothetical protein Vadar_002122 [Vaccinium darrowii]|uniref:Uncharacterized protein n=1 Tax=Vaccinium darrowii TaxID=229202 RepID=A0ACB7YJ63_9ERIC|nr:hypothetical protein Vadar_002122 [Vaccinium darrowii]
MELKAIRKLLILFLGFSFVLSSAAVPTSRILKSFKEDPSVQGLLAQGEMDMRIDRELSQVYMELARHDYSPGDTGANRSHDPKTPPGAP